MHEAKEQQFIKERINDDEFLLAFGITSVSYFALQMIFGFVNDNIEDNDIKTGLFFGSLIIAFVAKILSIVIESKFFGMLNVILSSIAWQNILLSSFNTYNHNMIYTPFTVMLLLLFIILSLINFNLSIKNVTELSINSILFVIQSFLLKKFVMNRIQSERAFMIELQRIDHRNPEVSGSMSHDVRQIVPRNFLLRFINRFV